MLNNCFRFAPRDSVPGLISKICGYLKEHPGWSVEELKEVIGDIEASLALGEVSYFTEQDIGYLDLIELYDVGYRFIFVGGQGVYAVMYALEKSDNVVTANGISLGVSDSEFNSLKLVVTGLVNTAYTTENPPPYPVTSVNGYTGEVATLRVDPDDPGIPADPPVPINANTLNGKSADFYATVDSVNRLLEKKANVIIDTSAKSAIHELYAQDGYIDITLYGQTTETGTGDKSPDNPYTIGGVDEASVHCGSKNLFAINPVDKTVSGMTIKGDGYGRFTVSGTMETGSYTINHKLKNPVKIMPGLKLIVANTGAHGQIDLLETEDAKLASAKNLTANKSIVVDLTAYTGRTIDIVKYWASGGGNVFSGNLDIMLTYSDDDTFEPYTANVIIPPLLPDGAPLMGNGTVDDSVENDVLSGCDKKIVLDGTQFIAAFNAASWKNCVAFMTDNTHGTLKGTEHVYGDIIPNGVFGGGLYSMEFTCANPNAAGYLYASFKFERLGIAATTDAATGIAAVKAYLAANPLTVFYRSTDYTPDKELRVCKTVRRWKTEILTGNESFESSSLVGDNGFYFFRTNNEPGIIDGTAETIVCNMLDESTHFVSAEGVMNRICNSSTTNTPRFILSHELIGTTKANTAAECKAAAVAWIKAMYEAGTPITYSYQLATEKNYVTDLIEARKPDTLTTDTVTVTGSAETAVEYPHDTKHYIDSQIAAAVALALNS